MRRLLLLILIAAPAAFAQFQLQTSNTTADLRGIANVGNGVAWASGTNGTVLRTEDGGYVWQTCAIPPDAEKLDFRGIEAFDANTAIVMSSGKGDLSRLYKTTDGCHTWKLLFTNPDPGGFWDAIVAERHMGLVVGDPVGRQFAIFWSTDLGLDRWNPIPNDSSFSNFLGHFKLEPVPYDGEGIFAASNSSAEGTPDSGLAFVTGGPKGAFFAYGLWIKHGSSEHPAAEFAKIRIPLAEGKSAGAFSFACAGELSFSQPKQKCVSVGGDYLKPDSTDGVAAYSSTRGRKWIASRTPPHGYRSSVAYSPDLKLWITVGPNGTDVSSDDGRNWRAIHPSAALHEPPDADRNWNALSLPFVVGPKGRIGKLDPAALSK